MEIHKLEDFGRPLSPREVASLLGVSVTTVYTVAGEYGGVRVGGKYVFFENVFFDRLKAKVLQGEQEKEGDQERLPPVLPGFDVAPDVVFPDVLEGA